MSTIEVNMSQEFFHALEVDPANPVEIIDLEQLISRDACITQITAKVQNDIVQASGTSRRHPGDKANEDIGRMLSYSRCLENLARKIRKRANGLVEQQAHNAAQRPLQLAKAAEWKAKGVMRVASPDSRVQVGSIRSFRDQEGSWSQVNNEVTGSNA